MKFLGKTKVERKGIHLPEKVLDFLLVDDGDELFFYEKDGMLMITRFPIEETADVEIDDLGKDTHVDASRPTKDPLANLFKGFLGVDSSSLEDVTRAMEQFLGPLVGNISQMMKQFQESLKEDLNDRSSLPDDEIPVIGEEVEDEPEWIEDPGIEEDEETRFRISIIDEDDNDEDSGDLATDDDWR